MNGYNGYTYEQLRDAFDKTQNPNDWKAPIYATIPAGKLAVTITAITYFTLTSVTVKPDPGSQKFFVVESIGYRAGPAGDH